MRLNWLRSLPVIAFTLVVAGQVKGQSCIPTGIDGRVIDFLCNQTCSTLVFQIPHIKGTDDYVVNTIPYTPYPYTVPTSTEITSIYVDDTYSPIQSMPFPFCFYGTTYSQFVAGSNGLITFDLANQAPCGNSYNQTFPIPYISNNICSNSTPYYPKASIMGIFTDLYPVSSACPPDRKIAWHIEGTAPCRKLVMNYYHVGMFGNGNYSAGGTNCNSLNPTTFQIVLYESTGLIEVYIEKKQCNATAGTGYNAILGIQDFTRTKYAVAPGKNATIWNENQTAYRFTPSGSGSRYVISEMLDMSGNVVATADTLTTVQGLLDIRFPNFCIPAGSTQYYVRTQFSACDNPANILTSLDLITLNRTNSLNATASTTNATCGPPDGTITVNVPAGVGTPPYTYVLDGGAPVTAGNSYTFTGVAPGTHTVVVTDASNGCTSNINVTVTLTGNIAIGTATTATACVGVNDGTISIISAGGTGPYTFAIDGGAPTPGTIPFTFNGLTAGTHTVVVNDLGTGCTSGSVFVTVSIGPGISGTGTTTPSSCVGVNNGTITVTANSGVAPFTWSLDGGAFVPGANPYTFSGVAAGGHNVTIRDANGCNFLVPVNVLAGSGVAGNGNSTATSCPGVNDGTITVTATQGSAPFTWSLDGGAFVPGPNPYNYTGIVSGSHTITIRDANGCTILVPVTVAAGPAPTATLNSTATSCTGVNNGSIVVNAATGTGPYTFSLDGGAPQAGAIPYTFSNVAAGSHTVTVVDVNGCNTGALPITVNTGAGVSGNATTAATSCPTASNGSITVNATAGVAPFTYQLDGGAPQSGANPYTFNNVAAGTHNAVITDNVGCTYTVNNITVNAGPALTANTATTATSCTQAVNGSITITPVGGAAPFTFTLDGGAPQAGTVPYTFSNLASGAHTITVTDAAGCVTGNIPVTVPAGPALTTTVSTTDVLCNGGSTGTLTIAVPTIGSPPYQYSIDNINWFNSNVFTGLPAGTYTAYFRESNGCQGQLNNQIINEPALLAAGSATTPVSCNGGSDGTITITGTGGITPYEYSIDGGTTWVSSGVFTVPANTYNIIIRDANLCTKTVSATVTQPAVLTASSVNTNASCNGGNDGTITITASGGNSGYQYSIDGTNFQASNIFNVAPNTYTVTVKDTKGCTFNFPATVGLSNNLTFTLMIDPTICEGSSASLNFVSNATAWSWAPSTGLNNVSVPNPSANPTVTTQYVVTATLDRCAATDTVRVNVNPAPIPDAGPPGLICFGQTYQLQGSGGVQYRWTPSTYLDNPSLPNPTANAAQTITYTLSILADMNGCPSLVTDDVIVNVTPPIKIYTYPADTIAYPGDRIQLKAVSTVPAANIFTWSPILNIDNPGISNPTVTAMNIGDSIIYKVTARSQAGCVGEAYVRFRVYKGPDLYVPNAFTPNGDGKNDLFYPFPVGIKAINYFRVYNRWGQLMFSSNVLYKGWDGKFNGTDQPGGVFVWMGQAIDKNNRPITRQGTVTLIR
ncbi:MAG: gliding motility-associated C-terminal domain-containing protein [Chitinophagaceae bacterium]